VLNLAILTKKLFLWYFFKKFKI